MRRYRPSNCVLTSRVLQDALVKIAKKLKKNNVAVDIVSFGENEENEEKVEAFHQAVNSNGNSNLVTVPPGPVLSDVLISSPIFQGEGGGAFGGGAGGGGGGGEGFELGFDPNLDPELALALRVSLEEERARQAAAATAEGGTSAATAEGAPAAGAATADKPAAAAAAEGGAAGMDLDDDALLQQALAMSMQVDESAEGTPAPAAPAGGAAAPGSDANMFDAVDEELQLALQLSMQDTMEPKEEGAEKKEGK